MEYRQTWRQKATPSGRLYWAHTASPRRMSAAEFSGWQSPTQGDAQQGNYQNDQGDKTKPRLSNQGVLVGYGTPDASIANDGESAATWLKRAAVLKKKHSNGNGCGMPLAIAAQLTGWSTSQHCDAKGARLNGYHADLGRDTLSSHVPMAIREGFQLNGAMSRWLMGFPATWDNASPNFDHWQKVQERIASDASEATATPSSHK